MCTTKLTHSNFRFGFSAMSISPSVSAPQAPHEPDGWVSPLSRAPTRHLGPKGNQCCVFAC
jgi:hypothetical protein